MTLDDMKAWEVEEHPAERPTPARTPHPDARLYKPEIARSPPLCPERITLTISEISGIKHHLGEEYQHLTHFPSEHLGEEIQNTGKTTGNNNTDENP